MTSLARWWDDVSPLPDPHGYGERAVKFLQLLKHPKSKAAHGRFELAPWQERIVRRVYGDTDDNGERRVKTVFMLLPRGNRKTSLGAGLALLHTVGPERIPGGQVVSAAVDRKQARIAFEEAQGIILQAKTLVAATQVRDARNRIEHRKSGAIYEAISAEAGGQHGRTPSFVLADELHAWRGDALWNVLRTGVTKTAGSLLWIITTAGAGQENLVFDLYQYARKIAAGEIDDPGFLPILFETPADADWKDEAVWQAANPGLAYGFPDIEGLRQLVREAEHRPSQIDAFRQLHLNVWLDGAATPRLDMAMYDAAGTEPIDIEEFEGETCWLGVDMAQVNDLSAVVAAFKDDDGGVTVVPWFFLPDATLRRRQERDGLPWATWRKQEHVIATEGDVTDDRRVEDVIRECCERFRVEEIALDPVGCRPLINRLLDDGLPAVEHRQGMLSMSPAVKATERAILSGKFRHGGHPVLRWNFANVVAVEDDAGNVKYSKRRSADKIDGAIAAVMAVGRAEAAGTTGSIYDHAHEGVEMFVL